MAAESDGSDRGVRSAEAWILGFIAGAVILAALIAAYAIGYSQGEGSGGGGGEEVAAEEASPAAGGEDGAAEAEEVQDPGRELFVSSCGSCHALEDAGTTASVGPDLDLLAPSEEQVLTAIEQGGAGTGQMPADLVTGEEAQQVAEYVAGAARR